MVNNIENEKRLYQLMELDATELNELLSTDLTEDERIDVTAIRILKEYRRAFEELAK